MIELKCPSCKADIILDESREMGFCMYCGTKVLLRETASTVDGIAGINNLLLRANQFLNDGNYDKALEYYNRVLDIDINNLQAQNGIKLVNSKRSIINIGESVTATVIDVTGRSYVGCIIVKLSNGQEVPLPVCNISPNLNKNTIINGTKYDLICVGYKKDIPQLMTQEVKDIDNAKKTTTFVEQLNLSEIEDANSKVAKQREFEYKIPQLIIQKLKYECELASSSHKLQGYFDTWNEGYGIEISFNRNKPIPPHYLYKASYNVAGFKLLNPSLLEDNLKKEIIALGFMINECRVLPINIVQKIGESPILHTPKYKNTGELCYVVSIDIEW